MAIQVRRSFPFNQIQRDLSRLFETAGRFDDDSVPQNGWAPAVDIMEENDTIVVRAELPGIRKEDINISFENGVLTLEGTREFEDETKERNYHRVERSYGRFVRSFTLPRSVDSERISASYEDGVLEVALPKKEEAKPRKIEIGKTVEN
ncbi:MAG: Hsp20/alpha crystallin family protein [Acidobacteria bacterium]|nr:Hsp20/alpha crystallin family protein [Acidobacteriota bacterium]